MTSYSEKTVRLLSALIVSFFCLSGALAADNVLLIQLQPGGQYKVWHTEGESMLSDEDVMQLEVAARPAGSAEFPTHFGPGRAFETSDGVVIELPDAKNDKAILVDRDSCGHIRLWHSAGTTNLTTEQITDIVISALPEGGPRLTLGNWHVKAFTSRLGVLATLWHAKKPLP